MSFVMHSAGIPHYPVLANESLSPGRALQILLDNPKTLDSVVIGLSPTAERMRNFTFSYPISAFREDIAAITSVVPQHDLLRDSTLIFSLFSVDVWISILMVRK